MSRPTFEGRHYRALAAILKSAKTVRTLDRSTVDKIEADLCALFAADNSRFSRTTFGKACTPRMEGLR